MFHNLRGLLVPSLACALLLGGSASVSADDAKGSAAGSWRLEVRVVRLEAPAATVEQPPTLPGQQSDGTTTAPWGEVLAALKARGTTQIVMDRSAAGMAGALVLLRQVRSENVMAIVRSDGERTFTEARPVTRGATVHLTLTPAETLAEVVLAYEANVDWGDAAGTAQVSVQANWNGRHRLAGGGTLVLRHGEQDGKDGGTEVYVLVSCRPLSR